MNAVHNFVSQSVTTIQKFGIQTVSFTSQNVVPAMSFALRYSVSKIKDLWAVTEPYLKMGTDLLTTKGGAATLCLIGGASCISLAATTSKKNKTFSNISFVLGVLETVAGSYLLTTMYLSAKTAVKVL